MLVELIIMQEVAVGRLGLAYQVEAEQGLVATAEAEMEMQI